MIGNISNSIGLGWGDLLLFLGSILAGAWGVRTWKRSIRSGAFILLRVVVMLLALIPFVMLGFDKAWQLGSVHLPLSRPSLFPDCNTRQ